MCMRVCMRVGKFYRHAKKHIDKVKQFKMALNISETDKKQEKSKTVHHTCVFKYYKHHIIQYTNYTGIKVTYLNTIL